jgi:N-methylhydantoinase A
MASAARVHAVERGLAIGDHTMIAFGGAAPLHAARVAEKLGIGRIVVPANAGVGSAVGFLHAPVAYEVVHSLFMRLSAFDATAANALLQRMAREAHGVVAPGAAGRPVGEVRGAYMRYVGQGHEILVTLGNKALAPGDAEDLRRRYEAAYAQLFARIIPGGEIEILSWSVVVGTEGTKPARLAMPAPRAVAKPSGRRAVYDAAAGKTAELPVYRRTDLSPGDRLVGPALIAEDATTTFVSARFDGMIDAAHNIVLTAKSSPA